MTTKTEAASQVRKVLQTVKDRLDQPGGSKVNEATTRAHFLNPLLEALGYRSIDDIVFEHYLPDGKTFLDYRLVVDGKARVSVEAKALDVGLTEKEAAQVVSYASILGDEWAVLTNARQWQLYHAFAQAPLAEKRMLTVDLVSWKSDAEFDAVFEQLWLISQDAFHNGDGPGSWLSTKKLDQWLQTRLTDPSSHEVKLLRKRAESEGLTASSEHIASWVRARTDAPAAPAKVPERTAHLVPTPSPTSSVAATQSPANTAAAVVPGYWIVPAGTQGGYSATEHLTAWLNRGFWGFGPSTAGRKSMKVGDWVAFYAAKASSVLAYGRISGDLDALVAADEWPGPGLQTEPVYKVPLTGITWLKVPVQLDAPTRATLDAYKGKHPAAGWAWLVQTTHRLSKADFERLTSG